MAAADDAGISAQIISEAIIRIHEKRPLSPLFEMGHK